MTSGMLQLGKICHASCTCTGNLYSCIGTRKVGFVITLEPEKPCNIAKIKQASPEAILNWKKELFVTSGVGNEDGRENKKSLQMSAPVDEKLPELTFGRDAACDYSVSNCAYLSGVQSVLKLVRGESERQDKNDYHLELHNLGRNPAYVLVSEQAGKNRTAGGERTSTNKTTPTTALTRKRLMRGEKQILTDGEKLSFKIDFQKTDAARRAGEAEAADRAQTAQPSGLPPDKLILEKVFRITRINDDLFLDPSAPPAEGALCPLSSVALAPAGAFAGGVGASSGMEIAVPVPAQQGDVDEDQGVVLLPQQRVKQELLLPGSCLPVGRSTRGAEDQQEVKRPDHAGKERHQPQLGRVNSAAAARDERFHGSSEYNQQGRPQKPPDDDHVDEEPHHLKNGPEKEPAQPEQVVVEINPPQDDHGLNNDEVESDEGENEKEESSLDDYAKELLLEKAYPVQEYRTRSNCNTNFLSMRAGFCHAVLL